MLKCRFFSQFRQFSSLPASARLLPMPRLSPTMTAGTITKWHAQPHDFVNSYQLMLEISVKDLEKLDSETVHNMEIEVVEDMYVAKILAKEGQAVNVGQPIAVLVDSESEMKDVESANENYNFDAYEYENGTKMALWEAFLKVPNKDPSCS